MRVPRIDMTQPGFPSNICSADERIDGSVVGVEHFIVPMKSGHMPGDIGGDPRQKTGSLPQLRV